VGGAASEHETEREPVCARRIAEHGARCAGRRAGRRGSAEQLLVRQGAGEHDPEEAEGEIRVVGGEVDARHVGNHVRELPAVQARVAQSERDAAAANVVVGAEER
jgi:hypothetical protein